MSPHEEASNWEVFLWALDSLGGAAQFVDVEDVFVRAFEIAPRRMAWRTRDDLPDYKKCSKGLRDAEARRPALLMKTKDGYKRQLTVEGQGWVSDNRARMRRLLDGSTPIAEPRSRPRTRLLLELERSEVYQVWVNEQRLPIEKWRVAELLHCSPDSDVMIWVNRLQVLRSAANSAERAQILHFLDELATANPDWFGEDTI